jgi:hypothetical protein
MISGMSVFVRSFKLSIFIGRPFQMRNGRRRRRTTLLTGLFEISEGFRIGTGTSARHHAFDARLEPRMSIRRARTIGSFS